MIDWQQLAWPANVWLLGAFVAILAVMSIFRRRVRLFAWLGGRASAVWSIACALIVTIVLGLLPQSRTAQGGWWQHLVSSWPFVIAWAWLAIALGLVTIRVIWDSKPPACEKAQAVCRRRYLHTIIFTLNHLGLLIALLAATLGTADVQRLRMAVGYEPQTVALDEKGEPRQLDFSAELLNFTIDEEPESGMPRKFTATVRIVGMHQSATSSRERLPQKEETIEVNHPAKEYGWKIYLIDYQTDWDGVTSFCVFELVRDPWLPWVYAGIAMMLVGAAGLFMLAAPKKKKL